MYHPPQAGVYLLASLLTLSGCAYVGAPLPPALNIPVAVADLVAVEYGDDILVRFTTSRLSTDGIPLDGPAQVELLIGPDPMPGAGNFDATAWAAAAQSFQVDTEEPGPQEYLASVAPFVGQAVIIGVRLTGPTGRLSTISNYDTLAVAPPLNTPTTVSVESVQQGVRLSWSGNGPRYRVLRTVTDPQQDPDTPEPALTAIGEVDAPEFIDTSTEYGTEYRYLVVAIADELQQSLPSDVAIIIPADEFAPAAPTGLSGVPGIDTIELAWARNTESDFRSYSVYRAVGDADFITLATGVGTPNFSDPDVATGTRYRYAVSSVDMLGNESPRTAEIEVVVP